MVRASALVVHIAPAGVRVPGVGAMDVGKTPCTEGAPISPKQDVSARPAHDSLTTPV